MESDMVQRKVEGEVKVSKDKDEIKSIEQILKIEDKDEMLEQLVLYAVKNNCSKVKDIVNMLMESDAVKSKSKSMGPSNYINIDDILDAIKRLAHKKVIILYNSSIASFKDYIKNIYLSMTLWITAIVTAVTILTIYILPDTTPWSIVRIVVGGAFVLFIPGYTLVQLLFPNREMDIVERIALSIGLSLAVVPLTGFLLNYSPWGIRLDPIVVSISSLSITLAIASIYRMYIMNVRMVKGEDED